jgi:hypothetical protein
VFFLGGGIHTKTGTCLYQETLKYKWSPDFLIWAANKKSLMGMREAGYF